MKPNSLQSPENPRRNVETVMNISPTLQCRFCEFQRLFLESCWICSLRRCETLINVMKHTVCYPFPTCRCVAWLLAAQNLVSPCSRSHTDKMRLSLPLTLTSEVSVWTSGTFHWASCGNMVVCHHLSFKALLLSSLRFLSSARRSLVSPCSWRMLSGLREKGKRWGWMKGCAFWHTCW